MKQLIIGFVGIILFAWFFIPGLLTHHFHIGTVTGIILSLLMIVYGLLFHRINLLVVQVWSVTCGRIVLCVIAAIAVAIFVLAVCCMACMGNGRGHLPRDQKTVVVLGCRVYSYGPSRMLRARLDAAYDYMEKDPERVCIVCGGMGDNEPVSESSVMKEYLIKKGISPERIYEDDISLDTLENLTNALEIIKGKSLDGDCAIVTSDYHIYRALKYAERLGFEKPSGLPAYTQWWLFPSNYVREMYGILEMWFLNGES